jgi:pyruvate dehydrogenase E2 component (dihydrolipoamide acetyltransferase)
MPSLGADMDYGTVIEWRVAEGDRVRRGDVVLLVDTEKAEIEVEIWEDGVLERIQVPAGQKVPVGTVLATLRPVGEVAAAPAPPAPAPPAPAAAAPAAAPPAAPLRPARAERAPEPAAPSPVPERAAQEPGERVHATPLARRVAAELGVELASVVGTGIEGAIQAEDVRRAAGARGALPRGAPAVSTAPAQRPSAAQEERRAAVRRRIADAMERSKREIPHYYLQTQVEVGRALAWLEAENLRRPLAERLLLAPLLLKAVARGVAAAPELNGHWVGGAFRPGAGVHVGVVVSLRGGGLLIPTLRDVDRKGVGELMGELRDVTQRARLGRLRGADVSEATISVTNLGDTGVETVFGIIYPPQVALVGFGRVTERPWAEDGLLGVRPALTVTLSADHRASDGQAGARLLGEVARVLRDPERT